VAHEWLGLGEWYGLDLKSVIVIVWRRLCRVRISVTKNIMFGSDVLDVKLQFRVLYTPLYSLIEDVFAQP